MQKFKAWHLQKNICRKAERKPRCTASIYRNGIGVGGKQRHSGFIALIVNENFHAAAHNRNSTTLNLPTEEQPDWIFEDLYIPNQTSNMDGPRENQSVTDEAGKALEPDAVNTSSTIALVNNNEMLDGVTPSVSMGKELSPAISRRLATIQH